MTSTTCRLSHRGAASLLRKRRHRRAIFGGHAHVRVQSRGRRRIDSGQENPLRSVDREDFVVGLQVLAHEHVLRKDRTDRTPNLLQRDGLYHAALDCCDTWLRRCVKSFDTWRLRNITKIILDAIRSSSSRRNSARRALYSRPDVLAYLAKSAGK